MKKIMLLSAVMGSLISVNAFAHNIQPNQLLANVTVSDKGEITLNGNDVAHLSDILDNGSNVVKFSEAHGTVKLNGFSETSGAENGYHRYESAYNTHLADGSDRQGTVYIDIKEDIHVDL